MNMLGACVISTGTCNAGKKIVDMRHRMKGDNSTHIDGSFRDWQKAKSKGFNSVQKVSEVSLKTA